MAIPYHFRFGESVANLCESVRSANTDYEKQTCSGHIFWNHEIKWHVTSLLTGHSSG